MRIYRNIRERAPLERWCDIGGVVVAGHVGKVKYPQLNVGPIMDGSLEPLSQQVDIAYALFRQAILENSGDPVYRCSRHASLRHMREEVFNCMHDGHSIVAYWPEVNEAAAKVWDVEGESFDCGDGNKVWAFTSLELKRGHLHSSS